MERIKELYETTELTLGQIAEATNNSYWKVWAFVKENYSIERRLARKSGTYRTSKLGSKNPMYNKTRDKHHNYIGEVGDSKGYRMVLKPEWYTGRKGSKHVFLHSVIMCEALGLTEIPEGFCVHHVDHNSTNNSIDNLALLTMSAHTRLHSWERAETSRKA